MSTPPDWHHSRTAQRKSTSRTWLQLALGVAQIAGATASLILLIAEGATRRAGTVVAVTLLISVASRWMFRSARNSAD